MLTGSQYIQAFLDLVPVLVEFVPFSLLHLFSFNQLGKFLLFSPFFRLGYSSPLLV